MNNSQLVEVYYNLHKHVFSIRDRKTKRVIDHKESILLKNCRFFVSEKGRQRVLQEQKKSVHAYVIGEIAGYSTIRTPMKEGYYNPYTCESFIDLKTNDRLDVADYVWLDRKQIYYFKGEKLNV